MSQEFEKVILEKKTLQNEIFAFPSIEQKEMSLYSTLQQLDAESKAIEMWNTRLLLFESLNLYVKPLTASEKLGRFDPSTFSLTGIRDVISGNTNTNNIDDAIMNGEHNLDDKMEHTKLTHADSIDELKISSILSDFESDVDLGKVFSIIRGREGNLMKSKDDSSDEQNMVAWIAFQV